VNWRAFAGARAGRNGNVLRFAYLSSPVDTPTAVEGGLYFVDYDTNTFHSCGADLSGALYCWGKNTEGQLGLGDWADVTVPTRVGVGSHRKRPVTGRFHTRALTNDGRVACMGANDDGQLGVGDTSRRNAPTFVNF